MSRNRCQPFYRYLPLWHLTGAYFYTDVTNCTINIKLETYIGELPTLYKTVQVQRVYSKASEKRCHCHTWSSPWSVLISLLLFMFWLDLDFLVDIQRFWSKIPDFVTCSDSNYDQTKSWRNLFLVFVWIRLLSRCWC